MDEQQGEQRRERGEKQIGCIGLGRMGANIVENLLEHGITVAAYDIEEKQRAALLEKRRGDTDDGDDGNDGTCNGNLVVTSSPWELAEYLGSPKCVLLMTPAHAVDDAIAAIAGAQPSLSKDDIIIDGGNSYFKDSIRRARQLKEHGIYFLDAGVSGGVQGARHGACFMIGGNSFAYAHVEDMLAKIAAPGGCRYVGPSGAGHFAKMVHNLIEYGMEKCIGEGVALLEQGNMRFFFSALNAAAVCDLWSHGSIIESKLLEYLAEAMQREDLSAKFGAPLEKITGKIGGGETGEWAVTTAMELKVPVPSCALALAARYQSQETDSLENRCVAGMRLAFGGHAVTYK